MKILKNLLLLLFLSFTLLSCNGDDISNPDIEQIDPDLKFIQENLPNTNWRFLKTELIDESGNIITITDGCTKGKYIYVTEDIALKFGNDNLVSFIFNCTDDIYNLIWKIEDNDKSIKLFIDDEIGDFNSPALIGTINKSDFIINNKLNNTMKMSEILNNQPITTYLIKF